MIRQIDMQGVTVDNHSCRYGQFHAEILSVILKPAIGRPVYTVRYGTDALPHALLGIVHPGFTGTHYTVEAISFDQFNKPAGAQLAACDHRFDIAAIGLRCAHIFHDVIPQRLVQNAAVIDLGRIDQHAFGKEIGNIHRETRMRRSDINHMPGATGKTDVNLSDKNRHDHTVIGGMRCAEIRMIVKDHVARRVVSRMFSFYAAHIGGQRTAMHRR